MNGSFRSLSLNNFGINNGDILINDSNGNSISVRGLERDIVHNEQSQEEETPTLRYALGKPLSRYKE